MRVPGDTGLCPGPGRSHMPRSGCAREPWPLSLCSATGEATTVRGPRTAKKNRKSRVRQFQTPPFSPSSEACHKNDPSLFLRFLYVMISQNMATILPSHMHGVQHSTCRSLVRTRRVFQGQESSTKPVTVVTVVTVTSSTITVGAPAAWRWHLLSGASRYLLVLVVDSIWQALNLRVAGEVHPRDHLRWSLGRVNTPQGQVRQSLICRAAGLADQLSPADPTGPWSHGFRDLGPRLTHEAVSWARRAWKAT